MEVVREVRLGVGRYLLLDLVDGFGGVTSAHAVDDLHAVAAHLEAEKLDADQRRDGDLQATATDDLQAGAGAHLILRVRVQLDVHRGRERAIVGRRETADLLDVFGLREGFGDGLVGLCGRRARRPTARKRHRQKHAREGQGAQVSRRPIHPPAPPDKPLQRSSAPVSSTSFRPRAPASIARRPWPCRRS